MWENHGLVAVYVNFRNSWTMNPFFFLSLFSMEIEHRRLSECKRWWEKVIGPDWILAFKRNTVFLFFTCWPTGRLKAMSMMLLEFWSQVLKTRKPYETSAWQEHKSHAGLPVNHHRDAKEGAAKRQSCSPGGHGHDRTFPASRPAASSWLQFINAEKPPRNPTARH